MFTALKEVVDLMRPPEPKIPQGRVHSVVIEDDEDIDEPQGELEILLEDSPVSLFLVYEGANGKISERTVTVRKLKRSHDNKILMQCYCHVRKASRTFRGDRIKEIIFPVTGEVISTQEELLEFLTSANEGAETYAAIESCKHAINVLVFLSRCDGKYRSVEEEVIVHYMMDKCFEYNVDETVLFTHLRRLCPDLETFYSSIDSLYESGDLKKVISYAVRLIEADGVIHENEHKFIMVVNERLSE